MRSGTFEHFKTIVIFVLLGQQSIASPSQFHKHGSFVIHCLGCSWSNIFFSSDVDNKNIIIIRGCENVFLTSFLFCLRLTSLRWSAWPLTERMAARPWRQMVTRASRVVPPTILIPTSWGYPERTWRSCLRSRMAWVSVNSWRVTYFFFWFFMEIKSKEFWFLKATPCL